MQLALVRPGHHPVPRHGARAAALLVCALLSAIVGCAGSTPARWALLSGALRTPGRVQVDSLQALVWPMVSGCSTGADSASVRHAWDLALRSTGPSATRNTADLLAALQSTLDESQCAPFTLEPQTFEGVEALMALQALPVVVTIDYAPSVTPLDPASVREGLSGALARNPEYLRLRIVATVSRDGDRCVLRFADGEETGGMPQDLLTGQVYPARTDDGRDTYHQVAAVLWLSPVPRMSVEAHLDEWYGTMGYTHERPIIGTPPAW